MSDNLSKYIGIIVGTSTGRPYAVINPGSDHELDDPRHLLLQNDQREPVKMVKVDRGAYEACMTPEDVATLLEQWYKDEAARIMREPPYDGPTYIQDAV